MAYATDVSYNITVQTIPIETMGKYEVHTNEPVAYNVDGSFSVVRYTGLSAGDAGIEDQDTTAEDGTAIANNDGGANMSKGTAPGDHLNPAKMLLSSSFDLEIKEKGQDDTPVFRINDCRIVRRGASLNKRGVLVDSYSFVAILAGDAKESDGTVQVASSSMDKAPTT
jgi:hypothetical protein